LSVSALVDTGAMTICIPEHVAVQLQLPEIEKREVTTADERSHVVPYVGPIQIRFQNRTCFTGALVLGDSVLLGAVPIEDMDLVISPSRQTIVVNPKSPNIPSAVVKQTTKTQEALRQRARSRGNLLSTRQQPAFPVLCGLNEHC
jgi:clan AA aspartic protease